MSFISWRERASRGKELQQRRHFRPALELLEDRSVPSVTINEFAVPTTGSDPYGIAAGPDGNLWFTELVAGKIGRISTSGTVTEYPLPYSTCQPWLMAQGPDGNLWFPESAAVPPGPTNPGPGVSNHIGRITPDGTLTEFPVPTVFSGPAGITAGPDGNLWFTELYGNRIGRVTPNGVVTEFPLPTYNPQPNVPFITAGPDGSLWFTEYQTSRIGRITTTGVITEFPVPQADHSLGGITAGPDGNVWFTNGPYVGQITPAGVINQFRVAPYSGGLVAITIGPDGDFYLTQGFVGFDGGRPVGNNILRVSTAGELLASYSIPSGSSNVGIAPSQITVGPDGNIWFTESGGNSIGQLVLENASTSIGLVAPTVTYGTEGFVTATVSSAAGTPTGSVSLSVDGTTYSATLSGGAVIFDVGVLSAGDHDLVVAYAAQGNFAASAATGTLPVNPAPLTVTAVSMSKTFGQAVTLAGTEFTASGLVNGDTVTSVTLSSTGATATAPVAGSPYAIIASAAVGTGLSNYATTYQTGTLAVNPALLYVTANDQTKIVGEANPAFSVAYSGFVLGEDPGTLGGTLTFSTPATASSPAGAYAITPGGLTSTNYAITFTSGTLTVLSFSQATNDLLLAQVNATSLPSGIQSSLDSQLESAIDSFDLGNSASGANQLQAFINHVRAQRGKSIDAALADILIAAAQRIIHAVV